MGINLFFKHCCSISYCGSVTFIIPCLWKNSSSLCQILRLSLNSWFQSKAEMFSAQMKQDEARRQTVHRGTKMRLWAGVRRSVEIQTMCWPQLVLLMWVRLRERRSLRYFPSSHSLNDDPVLMLCSSGSFLCKSAAVEEHTHWMWLKRLEKWPMSRCHHSRAAWCQKVQITIAQYMILRKCNSFFRYQFIGKQMTLTSKCRTKISLWHMDKTVCVRNTGT